MVREKPHLPRFNRYQSPLALSTYRQRENSEKKHTPPEEMTRQGDRMNQANEPSGIQTQLNYWRKLTKMNNRMLKTGSLLTFPAILILRADGHFMRVWLDHVMWMILGVQPIVLREHEGSEGSFQCLIVMRLWSLCTCRGKIHGIRTHHHVCFFPLSSPSARSVLADSHDDIALLRSYVPIKDNRPATIDKGCISDSLMRLLLT